MDTGAVALVITIIVIVVGGGLVREYIKSTKASKEAFGKRMEKLEERQDALEIAMEAQKELVADTIIRES